MKKGLRDEKRLGRHRDSLNCDLCALRRPEERLHAENGVEQGHGSCWSWTFYGMLLHGVK